MEDKIVAIHQPDFLPWLGFFNKLYKADVFIIMDNVQFIKSGSGTLSNRVKILIGGQPKWITMPIVRNYHGTRKYGEMQIDNSTHWRIKLIKTVKMNYSKTPFFKNVMPFIESLISYQTDSLVEYNVNCILKLAENLKLETDKIVFGSRLNGVVGSATDLLISMTKVVGGTGYMCGGGARGYQEDEKFNFNGLKLFYQNFIHPIYEQSNTIDFVAGLSIIDSLFNVGIETTSTLLKKHNT